MTAPDLRSPPGDRLWLRIHDALDAGRDPFDDDALLEALTANPTVLAELVLLRQRLAALGDAPPVTGRAPHRIRRRRAAAAFAAAALITACAWLAAAWILAAPDRAEPTEPAADTRPAAIAANPTPAGIVAFELAVTRRAPARTAVARLSGGTGRPTERSVVTERTWHASTRRTDSLRSTDSPRHADSPSASGVLSYRARVRNP